MTYAEVGARQTRRVAEEPGQICQRDAGSQWRRLWSSDFVRHALTLGAGNGVAQLIVLALSPAIARLYSPENFGLFAGYAALASVLTVVATAQYEAALMLPRSDRQAARLLLFIMSLCPGVALVFGLPLVIFRHDVAALLNQPPLAHWLWALPVSVVLLGWYQALRFWTMRRGAFADVANNAVTRVAVGAALACVLGIWRPFPGAPEAGLILSQMLGEGFGNLLLAYRAYCRDPGLCSWPGGSRLLATGRRWRSLALPLAASQSVAMCYGRLPVVAIGWLFGPAAAGQYAWAERFAVLPAQLVAAAVGDVYRQRATIDYHRDGKFDQLMRRTLALTAAMGSVPFALGIAIAPTLFAWLFGSVWQSAGVFAQILMVGGFVSFVLSPVDKGTIIFRKTRFIMGWHVARLVLKLAVIAMVAIMGLSILEMLWLIVAIRVCLYCIDAVYQYRLARGSIL